MISWLGFLVAAWMYFRTDAGQTLRAAPVVGFVTPGAFFPWPRRHRSDGRER